MNDQARWQRANPAAPEFLLENSPFYWLTRVSGRYLLQMERHLKAIGMDVPRWRVLMILAEDEPATITTLSERSVVKLATMTRIVQRMVAAALVTTEGSPTDGRVTQVCMTAPGREALARVRAEGSRVFAATFADGEAGEVEALVSQLRRLFDRLNGLPLPTTRLRAKAGRS
jgi:DNA-binding MarR family transcriptional regulator